MNWSIIDTERRNVIFLIQILSYLKYEFSCLLILTIPYTDILFKVPFLSSVHLLNIKHLMFNVC